MHSEIATPIGSRIRSIGAGLTPVEMPDHPTTLVLAAVSLCVLVDLEFCDGSLNVRERHQLILEVMFRRLDGIVSGTDNAVAKLIGKRLVCDGTTQGLDFSGSVIYSGFVRLYERV